MCAAGQKQQTAQGAAGSQAVSGSGVDVSASGAGAPASSSAPRSRRSRLLLTEDTWGDGIDSLEVQVLVC